jgi:hypothetical protein
MNGQKSDETFTALVKMETTEQAKAISEIARVSGGKRAEAALLAIASTTDDSAAIAVLQRLNPFEIGLIIKGHDVSLGSATAWLAEPDKLAEMLAVDSQNWEQMFEEKDLLEIQADALQLLATIIISTPDAKRRIEVLQALGKNENSFFYLCLPFIGHGAIVLVGHENLDRLSNEAVIFGGKIPADRLYQELLSELFQAIEHLDHALAEEMAKFVNSENEEEDDDWQKLKRHIGKLQEQAEAKQNANSPEEEEEFEEMFEPKK